MNPLNDKTRQFVLDLLDKVPDMTLATVRPDGYPQATAVGYACNGLKLYVMIGLDSQKAHNIQQSNKVSMAVSAPYRDWNEIQGVSMSGTATIVTNADELETASACLFKRFPQMKTIMPHSGPLPWPGAIIVRLVPQVVSVLDYTQGFGHTELFDVEAE